MVWIETLLPVGAVVVGSPGGVGVNTLPLGGSQSPVVGRREQLGHWSQDGSPPPPQSHDVTLQDHIIAGGELGQSYLGVVVIRDVGIIIRDTKIINQFIRRTGGVHYNVLEVNAFQNNNSLLYCLLHTTKYITLRKFEGRSTKYQNT